LKIQLPFPVRCVAAFPCDDVARVEAELHKLFKAYRSNGEWFTLPDVEPRKVGPIWLKMGGMTWLKNIRYATTGFSPYSPLYPPRRSGIKATFHDEVPLAVQNDEAWRKAFAAASDAVEVG
jgi:hypothetical protein